MTIKQEMDYKRSIIKLEIYDIDAGKMHTCSSITENTNYHVMSCTGDYAGHEPLVYVDNAEVNCVDSCNTDLNTFSGKVDIAVPDIKHEHDEYVKHKGNVIKEMYACTQCNPDFNTLDNIQLHKEMIHNGQFMDQCKHGEPEGKSSLVDAVNIVTHSSSSEDMIKDTGLEIAENKASLSSKICWNKGNDICVTPTGCEVMGLYGHLTQEVNNKFLVSEANAFHHQNGSKGHESQGSSSSDKLKISEKLYKCDLSIAHSSSSSMHNRKHVGKKSYKCDVCGAGFTSSSGLRYHKRTHTGEKPVKCDVCGAGFTSSSGLIHHKQTHTGEKPFKCDACGVGFTSSSGLNYHKKTHTGEKPFKCDVCNVCFVQSGDLRVHIRKHTREKPYKCDVCGAGFARSGYLHVHKRKHTGEKPYKCDICGVGFPNSSYLSKHLKKHSEEKPYKCEDCGVGLSSNNSLKDHKRIHTGEKPYKCNVCAARFAHKNSLTIHERKHTGGNFTSVNILV